MTAPQWWKKAACYQIYPRSFADSNGDGIGDLRGIIEKLDYLEWLGINAIWISPFYPSPNFDWGYDVADYTGIDPDYGTMADFDELLDEAHRRDIRILLDLVLNHTSNQHRWFQESKSSRDNPYRDWYVWRDGQNGSYPNNWNSIFGGPAWTFDPETGQYYYHFFFSEQPDLNWRNPEVKQAMFDSIRFWLDKGVDGFRLDAIGAVYEFEDLRDSEGDLSLEDLFIDYRMGVVQDWKLVEEKQKYQQNLPEMHTLLADLRALIDEYDDRVLLGETEDIAMYGNGLNQLHSVFNFDLMGSLNADRIRALLRSRYNIMPADAWESNTVSNHDRRRSYTHFSDGQHDELRARLALALVTFLQGTPVYYNGEEIGMRDLLPVSVEDFKDSFGTRYYNLMRERRGLSHEEAFQIAANYICRDVCRTPVQWRNAPNAGFSPEGVEPWLPVHPNYADGINVEDQRDDPASMLNFLRELVQFRGKHDALQLGSFELIEDSGDVLAFWRRLGDQAVLVALNMSAEEATPGIGGGKARCLYTSAERPMQEIDLGTLRLRPYEIFVGESL